MAALHRSSAIRIPNQIERIVALADERPDFHRPEFFRDIVFAS